MSKARELAELGAVYNSGALSNRNIIINGAMQIYQKGAGTYTNNNIALDRWKFTINGNDEAAGTITQVADAPSGFATSLKLTTTTAESAWAANEYSHLSQLIEARNLQSFGWGTSSAKPLTLSFYVKSSVTGTFAVGIYKADNQAVISNKTYTINSANTWEYKTVTFTANTTNDAINNDNGIGFYLNWHLAAGSDYTGGGSLTDWTNYGGDTFWANGQATNVLYTTNSSTWQLTGCQLEVGTEATPFEHRSFGDELARCKRYFERLLVDVNSSAFALGYGEGASQIRTPFKYETKRSNPSLAVSTAGNWEFVNGVESKTASAVTGSALGKQFGVIFGTVSGATISRVYYARASAGEYIDLDSEL